jgi:hypothetical protein
MTDVTEEIGTAEDRARLEMLKLMEYFPELENPADVVEGVD